MEREECSAEKANELAKNYEDLLRQNKQLTEKYEQLAKQYKECKNNLRSSELMVRNLRNSYTHMKSAYTEIVCSRGWRILNGWYTFREFIFPRNSVIRNLAKGIARLIFGAKRDASELVSISSETRRISEEAGFESVRLCDRIDILSVPHTEYLAKMLQSVLRDAGLKCNTYLKEPEKYEDIPYIMICPQNFKRFPDVYIAMQMEQTINPRWLTEEYMNILHNAYAVFDYSLENIKYFNEDPLLASKMFYMPVDVCKTMMAEDYSALEKEYDVLFYGAPFIERRQNYLKPIGEKFNLRVVSEQFGPELYREMNKAKIIINIHYYEDALLETTRLYETLSVSDCLIISERSGDPQEEARLEGLVDFVEVGDVEAMMERIQYWLTHEEECKEKIASNREKLEKRASCVKFYLYRFLLANDRITFDEFYNAVGDYIHFDTDRICLSLPESTERSADFIKDNAYGFKFCPGLRHRMGWIGCGMSYKFMLRKAMEQNMERILICEDDVYFPPDFEERFNNILDYVGKNDDWNVFSGIMADLGRVKPLKYVEESGEEYIYLDKMISMVFNLYDKSIFEAISNWDNMNRNVQKNTIDRFLENRKMRILTTCPFLVGHKEDLQSTIWGQENSVYSQLIENSSVKLREIVDKFKETQM